MSATRYTKAQEKRAEKLWNDLRASFFQTQETFIQIIKERSWEPLGFDSFTDAYSYYLSDISLAKELIPHVVYALLDDGADDTDIIKNVRGVSDTSVANLKRQKQNGVPANVANPHAKRKDRKYPPARDSHMYLEFTPDEISQWRAACKDLGINMNESAVSAVRAAMREIAKGVA